MSKVRNAKELLVIQVESTTGQGNDDDPVRVIFEYFSRGGELLAFRDSWAEETKAKDPNVELLVKSYPLTEYISSLSAKIDIVAQEGESVWEIALRCWKADRDKLDTYAPLLRMAEEARAWRKEPGIATQWIHYDNSDVHHCVRCGSTGSRNEEKLCFACWDKLSKVLSLME